MKCKKCGTENTEENQFCSKCGKKLTERKKMDSKKKKIIIIVTVILLSIIIIVGIFLFINNRNKEIYKNATNKFIMLDFKEAYLQFEKIGNYKNAKNMKESCISQAEETINSMIESNNYEKAIELCSFINEHKDYAEVTKNVKTQYIEYLFDESQEIEAYNYLPNFPEIEPELLNRVQINYIERLLLKDEDELAFETMKSIESITESNKEGIFNTYIRHKAYKKAYNSLYNAMRNPSSLRVKNVSYTLYCSKPDEEYKSGYNKETGEFKIQVHFTYSGQNGFGGMTSGYKTYVYDGKLNFENYDLYLGYSLEY